MILAATLALTGPSAFAEDRPDVAIVGIHQRQAGAVDQDAAVALLATAIAKTNRFDVVLPDELSIRLQGRERLVLEHTFLGQGKRLLEDGRLLYEQAEAEQAAVVLREAVDSLRAGAGVANSTRDLWEAWMYLGTSYYATDATADANQAWRAAIALNPARNPDTTRFAPDIVAAFDAARIEHLATKASLSVQASVADVSVWIDGELRGEAPLTIQGIAGGEHHVLAVAPDGMRAYHRIEIPPGTAPILELSLNPAALGPGGGVRSSMARQTSNLYRSIAMHGDVDVVLLVGQLEGQVQVQVFSAASDGFSTPVASIFTDNAADEAVDLLPTVFAYLDESGALAADSTVPTAMPLDVADNAMLARLLLNPASLRAPDQPPSVRKPIAAYITAGALGAAAIATGAVLFVTHGSPGPGYEGTVVIKPPE